ncbi:hypothetical protein DXG01_013736 [Tephrocybe rancida]|nr:hypothetical protein DXG01_013736 [Tephrocybe rancida]
MGFLKRIFSIGSKKNKKQQRPQIVHNVDARIRALEEEEHEAAVGRLLRSSSTRYTVVSEVEYSSLPPLPHPINNVLHGPGAKSNALRTPGAETASLASSTISHRGTYNVTVHKRTQHSSTRPEDVVSSERTSNAQEPKELSSHLLELRSHPSVASLLDMYDEQGRIPDQAFSNSPPSPEKRERAQTRRNGSTLRQLLGEPASMSSRNGHEASSAEGDISWAERFLGESDSVSSAESSCGLRTPSTPNAHFDTRNSNLNDHSFATEHDFSMNTSENPAISSLEVELSINDSLPSAGVKPANPYKYSDATTPRRASQVFQFLTERKRSTYNDEQDRSLPDLPSTFSVSSDEGSSNRSNEGRSHFSDDSFEAATQAYPATSNKPSSDTSQPDQAIPRSKFSLDSRSPSFQTVNDASPEADAPVNATETVWVAPNARRMSKLVNAPTRVIITAPTPSGKVGTPSRIPRGPRSQYRRTSASSNKVRRISLAERAVNAPAPIRPQHRPTQSSQDPFTPVLPKHRHRRTPSGGSSSSTQSCKIEISAPTRLSRRGGSTRSILSEIDKDKENGAELSVKSTLPSTPLRSKSDSRSLFRAVVTPAVFRPPPGMTPSPVSSSELSPVGKQLMMNVRQQRSKARDGERHRRGGNGARFGFSAKA